MSANTTPSPTESLPAEGSIVVPAVSVPSTVACLRSLAPRGVHTIVIAADPNAMAFASTYCDEAVLVPDPTEDLEGYTSALLALARREDVRTIVPVREEDAFVLSSHRETFSKHVATPWPDPETLERVHDRVLLAEAANAAGVPVPETAPLESARDWNAPRIVKSRYNLLVEEYVDTVSAGTVEQPNAVEHVGSDTVPDRKALRQAFGHDPIVQEFVPIDDEYMVGALYDHGEPVATFQHKQVRGSSYTGGGGVYRESTYNPALETAALELLGELEWHGLACIEYMRHPETGEFYLTEINPRMWTSLSANVQMGADFPWYYWQLACGRSTEIDPRYRDGVGSHYLKGELMHFLSLFREESDLIDRPSYRTRLGEILWTCYTDPTFDIFSRDDPWPFVLDFLQEVEGVSGPLELATLARRLGRGREPVHWRDVTPPPPQATVV